MMTVVVSNISDDVNGTTTSIAALIANPGSDGISLREAILASNANSDADEIAFDSKLLASGPASITLTNGQLPTIGHDLEIDGLGTDRLTIDANHASRVFQIASGAAVTLSELTITGGASVDTGAGIYNAGNLTLQSVHVTDNHTTGLTGDWNDDGAGIDSVGGSLHVDGSTIDFNSARFVGGINFVADSSDDTLEMVNSLVANNSTLYVDGFFGHIGGMSVSVSGGSSGSLKVLDSTIADNHANNTAGIFVGTGAHLEITNSTITGNVASGSVGGIHAYGSGAVVTLKNTIVAKNSDNPSLDSLSFNRDLGVAAGRFDVTHSDHNLIGVAGWSGFTGFLVGSATNPQDPKLSASLGDYGGPTQTYALLPNSDAVNAGSNSDATAAGLTTDQRGFNRFVYRSDSAPSNYVDIGAYELGLVVSSADDGEPDGNYSAGNLTLREAIDLAHANPGLNEIEFNLDATAPQTINLSDQLSIDSDVKIIGPGAQSLSINAQGHDRVFDITGGVVEISGVKITGGGGVDEGAGILNAGDLTLDSVDVTDNHTTHASGDWNDAGGGIDSLGGSLRIYSSSIDNNSARFVGGINFVADSSLDTLEIANSLITGNRTEFVDGFYGHIGAMSVSSTVSSTGPLKIVNSTIFGNYANNMAGIFVGTHSHLEITNSTISGNVASGVSAGIDAYGSGALVTLNNTIVAKNQDTMWDHYHSDVTKLSGQFDVTNSNNNLIGIVGASGLDENGSNLCGDTTNPKDPKLAALGNYGGPTQSLELLPNSPAIDAGNVNLALGLDGKPLVSDQRGNDFYRVHGAQVDIGAAEANVAEDAGGMVTIYGTALGELIAIFDSSGLCDVYAPSFWDSAANHSGNYLVLPLSPSSITAYGFNGNDTVAVLSDTAIPIIVHGGQGEDTLLSQNQTASLYGDAGNDKLISNGAHGNYLYGGDGDDTLLGDQDSVGGDDHMYGGNGNDILHGGPGNDTLEGEAGDDNVDGGSGSDKLKGGSEDDTLHGGSGDDILIGGAGDDNLYGDSGDDTLTGGSGVDNLYPGLDTDSPGEVHISSPSGSVVEDTPSTWTLDWSEVDPSVSEIIIDWGDQTAPTHVSFGVTSVNHMYADDSAEQPSARYEIVAAYQLGDDKVYSADLQQPVMSTDVVHPVNISALGYPAVTLTWNNDLNLSFDKVMIYRSLDGLSGWTSDWPDVGVPAPNSTYTYYGDQQKYYYRLTTIRDGVESPPSLPVAQLDNPKNRVVELSADVDTSGLSPSVTLSWPNEYYLTGSYAADVTYTIYRKAPSDSDWGKPIAIATAAEIGNEFVDNDPNLKSNAIYDYRVDRNGGLLGTATGYDTVGIDLSASTQEDRGSIELIVDNRFVDSLAYEIARLEQDLAGDGWNVIRHDINVSTTPATAIRNEIIADYQTETAHPVRSVLLLGNIPVPETGWFAPDGHTDNFRPLPADVYYGDMDGSWPDLTLDQSYDYPHQTSNTPGDGRFDDQVVPDDSDHMPVELSVGRIDMHNLTGFDPSTYYTKNGDWQHYVIPVGQEFTGTFDYLSLVSGSVNPTDLTGTSEFRNLIIHNGGPTPDVAIDWNGLTFTSARELPGAWSLGTDGWGSPGNAGLPVDIPNDSSGRIILSGNSWKVGQFGGEKFVINPDTWIEVDFRTSHPADVVAIGFDKEDTPSGPEQLSEDYTFTLNANLGIPWGRPIDPNLETELLRRYLDKDHAFRTGAIDVQRKAFIDDTLVVSTPFRDFAPLFGADNVDIQTRDETTWSTYLQTHSYMWGYGGGTGDPWDSSGVLSTQDLISHPSNAVFTEMYGSFSVDWSYSDGLLRSILANDGIGLTSTWGDGGQFSYYDMGHGATIGESYLVTQNQGQEFGLGNFTEPFLALMGDPTLRMESVAPPSDVETYDAPIGGKYISWTNSPSDGIIGYHVYRADSNGFFQRLDTSTGDTGTGSDYLDPDGTSSDRYMIRAIKLEVGPSGTYYNLSEGAFLGGTSLFAAVNAGGDILESLGNTFLEDSDSIPSSLSNYLYSTIVTIPVATPVDLSRVSFSVPIGIDPAIFHSARVGYSSAHPMQWDFGADVEGDTYEVRLLFAEPSADVGDRVFDVSIDGDTVLDNFDIAAEAGARTGLVKTFFVTGDGDLNIDFTHVSGDLQPLICGIEVYHVDPLL